MLLSVLDNLDLNKVHKKKIDLSHGILVIDNKSMPCSSNKNSYVGESTRNEINHAKTNGKTIKYVSIDGMEILNNKEVF